MSPITILSGSDIDLISSSPTFVPKVIASQRAVFLAFSARPQDGSSSVIQIPHRLTVSTENHKVLVMPSRTTLEKGTGTGCKIVSVPTRAEDSNGLPGATVVLDEETGVVRGVVNSRKLTALRNACGSALFYQTIQPLLPEDHKTPRKLTIFGSGHQSLFHAILFIQLFPSISLITIVGRRKTSRLVSLVEDVRMEARKAGSKVRVEWGTAGAIWEEGENGIEGSADPEGSASTPVNELHLAQAMEDIHVSPPGARHHDSAIEEGSDAEFEIVSVSRSASKQSSFSEPHPEDSSVLSMSSTWSHPQQNGRNQAPGDSTPSRYVPKPKSDDKTYPFNLPQTLHNSDIVICCTPSMKPLFRATHLTSGTGVILIGSYTPEMQEVEEELVRRAGVVVVDSNEACSKEAGDLLKAGWRWDQMVELGLVMGEGAHIQERLDWVKGTGDVFMYKSVGIGIQDVAVAAACLDAAQEMGIGTEVPNFD